MGRELNRRRFSFVRNESGLSMIETITSLTVLGFVALGLVHTSISGFRALRTTKTTQQATGVGNEVIEAARASDYSALSMITTDLAGDTNITTTCGSLGAGYYIDPDGTGPLGCEPLVHSAAGGTVTDHQFSTTVGNESYSVSEYITWVDADSQGGSGKDMKRVVTIVTWVQDGQPKSYRTSTVLNGTAHGVPLVDFELTPATSSRTAFLGEQVSFAHALKNLGGPDSFDLSLPDPVGRSWTQTFYLDVNNNDFYDAGTDTALTDTNGNGVVDTGTLATDQTINFIEVWTLGAAEATGIETLTLTATSFFDATVTRSATLDLTITGTPPGLLLYLHNDDEAPTGNTTATKAMPLSVTEPTATTLYRYSTDVYSVAGRVTIDASPVHTEPDANEMVNWVWQAPVPVTLEGTMSLKLTGRIVPDDQGKCNQGDWDVFIRKKSSSSTDAGTLIAQDTKQKNPGCGIFTDTDQITIPRTTLNVNEWLEIKIMTDKTKGPGIAWYYDTVTYDSYVEFPQVVIRA